MAISYHHLLPSPSSFFSLFDKKKMMVILMCSYKEGNAYRNPSLGLATKTRAYKGAGQE
jgi:hypothetical protein